MAQLCHSRGVALQAPSRKPARSGLPSPSFQSGFSAFSGKAPASRASHRARAPRAGTLVQQQQSTQSTSKASHHVHDQPAAPSDKDLVTCQLLVPRFDAVEQKLVLVGNVAQLGSWRVTEGITLHASSDNERMRSAFVRLPLGQKIEAKLVAVKPNGQPQHEEGSNHVFVLTLPEECKTNSDGQAASTGGFLVLLHWGLPAAATETTYFPPLPVGPAALQAVSSGGGSSSSSSYGASSSGSHEGEQFQGPVLMDPFPMCQFTVPHMAVSQGSYLVLCGGIPDLGSWRPDKGLRLSWQPGDSWVGRIRLPANAAFEAKVVVVSEGRFSFEPGPYRTLNLMSLLKGHMANLSSSPAALHTLPPPATLPSPGGGLTGPLPQDSRPVVRTLLSTCVFTCYWGIEETPVVVGPRLPDRVAPGQAYLETANSVHYSEQPVKQAPGNAVGEQAAAASELAALSLEVSGRLAELRQAQAALAESKQQLQGIRAEAEAAKQEYERQLQQQQLQQTMQLQGSTAQPHQAALPAGSTSEGGGASWEELQQLVAALKLQVEQQKYAMVEQQVALQQAERQQQQEKQQQAGALEKQQRQLAAAAAEQVRAMRSRATAALAWMASRHSRKDMLAAEAAAAAESLKAQLAAQAKEAEEARAQLTVLYARMAASEVAAAQEVELHSRHLASTKQLLLEQIAAKEAELQSQAAHHEVAMAAQQERFLDAVQAYEWQVTELERQRLDLEAQLSVMEVEAAARQQGLEQACQNNRQLLQLQVEAAEEVLASEMVLEQQLLAISKRVEEERRRLLQEQERSAVDSGLRYMKLQAAAAELRKEAARKLMAAEEWHVEQIMQSSQRLKSTESMLAHVDTMVEEQQAEADQLPGTAMATKEASKQLRLLEQLTTARRALMEERQRRAADLANVQAAATVKMAELKAALEAEEQQLQQQLHLAVATATVQQEALTQQKQNQHLHDAAAAAEATSRHHVASMAASCGQVTRVVHLLEHQLQQVEQLLQAKAVQPGRQLQQAEGPLQPGGPSKQVDVEHVLVEMPVLAAAEIGEQFAMAQSTVASFNDAAVEAGSSGQPYLNVCMAAVEVESKSGQLELPGGAQQPAAHAQEEATQKLAAVRQEQQVLVSELTDILGFVQAQQQSEEERFSGEVAQLQSQLVELQEQLLYSS